MGNGTRGIDAARQSSSLVFCLLPPGNLTTVFLPRLWDLQSFVIWFLCWEQNVFKSGADTKQCPLKAETSSYLMMNLPFISNLKFPSLFCLLVFVYTCTPRPKVVPSIMHLFLRVIWIVHIILYLMWGQNRQNKNRSWQMGKELCCSTRCAPVCARLQQEERLIFMIMNVYQFHLCSCISFWISISVKNAQCSWVCPPSV